MHISHFRFIRCFHSPFFMGFVLFLLMIYVDKEPRIIFFQDLYKNQNGHGWKGFPHWIFFFSFFLFIYFIIIVVFWGRDMLNVKYAKCTFIFPYYISVAWIYFWSAIFMINVEDLSVSPSLISYEKCLMSYWSFGMSWA